eukprot:TRINITY_DN5967_c0_g1_i1.p1 TRINITY_DN5967_c0_g1~~TRINITY_DN5967_c0_g1_i1.p1  ORF type:complete len:328 (+),score=62.61 TRINITY_DN5967_c0_g1_i1:673-1656(+)
MDQGEDIESCAYCLRTIFGEDGALAKNAHKKVIDSFLPLMNNFPLSNKVLCPDCEQESYCSEQCRAKAFRAYHKVICPKAESDHSYRKIYDLARKMKRTNPLLIMRMFAVVAQKLQEWRDDEQNGEKDNDDQQAELVMESFQQFSNFVANEEKSDGDDLFLQLFVTLFNRIESPYFRNLLNISTYRRLNGSLLRNASKINPVSPFHEFFLQASPSIQSHMVKLLTKEVEGTLPGLFFENEVMKSMCISAAGLFPVIDSVNHSCQPNVAVVSCFPDFRLQLVAIRPIMKGDEICFSYIDEDQNGIWRRQRLKEMYLFDCQCPKCLKGL